MRRLFLVHFSCPLCGQEHSCELYLTLVATTEDEMMERALETLSRDDVKVNSLAPFMKEYHQKAGDYLERATGYARQGIRHPFQVTRVVMTDEESYTCEYCQTGSSRPSAPGGGTMVGTPETGRSWPAWRGRPSARGRVSGPTAAC